MIMCKANCDFLRLNEFFYGLNQLDSRNLMQFRAADIGPYRPLAGVGHVPVIWNCFES